MMTGIAVPAKIADRAPSAAVIDMSWLARWETIFHICLSGLTLMAYSVESVPEIFWTAIAPCTLLILLTWGALELYKTDPLYLLTAGFWFRIAAAAFFGLGGLWRVLATETTLTEILTFFNPSQDEMNKAQMVVTVSICIIIAVSNLVEGSRRKATTSNLIPVEAEKWLPAFTFGCLLIGIPVLVYFTMQTLLGFEAETNGFTALGNLAYLGIFLAVYAGFRGKKMMLLLGIAGTALLVLHGAVLAIKQVMLLPLIMAAIAHLLCRPKLRNAVLWAAGIGLTYALSAPYVTYSRTEAFHRYGMLTPTLAVRLQLIDNYLAGDRGDFAAVDDYQLWLARISYLPSQAFAVASYDAGRRATSVDLALYVLVPRLLMPDKPDFLPGVDYNVAVFANGDSQSSPSLVAEGYYVGGWPGVIFWMSLYGAEIGLYSREAIRRLRAGDMLFLPVILIALQVGQGATDWIVGVILGSGVIIAFAYAASWVAHCALKYLWSETKRLAAT
jgi:hypothetical protein